MYNNVVRTGNVIPGSTHLCWRVWIVSINMLHWFRWSVYQLQAFNAIIDAPKACIEFVECKGLYTRCMHPAYLTWDRDQWNAFVSTVMNFLLP